MSDFESLKTLFYTIAPFAIPYVISSYRKYQAYSRAHKAERRPVPRRIGLSLNILFVAALIALVASAYAFSYENIFTKTASRLQTPSNVLWERVAKKRPGRTLTELDEKLQDRLASVDARCLYLMYGPDTIANCPFCNSDEPMSFFYYAMPSILLPHLLNFIVLGFATSNGVAGREGSRFRASAAVVGCVLALVELAVWYNYDWKANAKATKSVDLFQFFGWIRLSRSIAIAVVDAGFAWFLWATSTNRILVVPPSARERLENVIKQLEICASQQAATGIIHNAIVRNEELHKNTETHWTQDSILMQQVMADPEVQKGLLKAKSLGRLDMDKLELEAAKYAESLIPPMSSWLTTPAP